MKFPKIGNLTYPERDDVLRRLSEQSQTDHGYYLMVVLSIIIATLGLILDSAAVIIGGMIVSPMLYPMIAIGAAIATGDANLLKHSLSVTLKSSAVAIVGAIVITFISPLDEPTREILSRTEPTLIDLIVALASGLAGAYAIIEKDRLISLMGVAVAAAIVPPLSVTGYAVATASPSLLLGGSLLFLTNLLAIIMATIVLFYLMGFRPGRTIEKRNLLLGVF